MNTPKQRQYIMVRFLCLMLVMLTACGYPQETPSVPAVGASQSQPQPPESESLLPDCGESKVSQPEPLPPRKLEPPMPFWTKGVFPPEHSVVVEDFFWLMSNPECEEVLKENLWSDWFQQNKPYSTDDNGEDWDYMYTVMNSTRAL